MGLPVAAGVACGSAHSETRNPSSSVVEVPDDRGTPGDSEHAVPGRAEPRSSSWQPASDSHRGCTVERFVPSGYAAQGFERCPTQIYAEDDPDVPDATKSPRPPQLDDASALPFDEALTWEARENGARNACCYYEEVVRVRPVPGRPFRPDGEARVAPTVGRSDWARGRPAPIDAPRTCARAAGERWSRAAAFEHASVASFAELALDLMALGAPPELIAGAHRAALDEIDHAERSFAIASALLAEPIGPGRLEVSGGRRAVTVERLIGETLADGCLGETAAALVARRGAELAPGGPVADALRVIADDEERHAELAFRVLAWAVASHSAGPAALRRAIDELRAEPPADTARPPMHDFGLLGTDDERSIRASALETIVLPCARELLAAADEPAAGVRQASARAALVKS